MAGGADSAFSTWMYRIVTNRCLNVLRERRPDSPLPEDHRATGEGPAEVVEEATRIADLRRAIERLTPEQRAPVVLRELEGCSYEQLAEALDITVTGAELLAKAVYWTVLGLAILLAADQLGVETAAAQRLVFVSLALAGAAAALAVGLGGTALAGNVVAGRYVDDRFRVGERIEVGDYSGEVVEVGIASVSVAEQDGTRSRSRTPTCWTDPSDTPAARDRTVAWLRRTPPLPGGDA